MTNSSIHRESNLETPNKVVTNKEIEINLRRSKRLESSDEIGKYCELDPKRPSTKTENKQEKNGKSKPKLTKRVKKVSDSKLPKPKKKSRNPFIL